VTVTWTTDAIPLELRRSAVVDAVCEQVVRVDIDLPVDPDEIDVRMMLSDIGRVQMLSMKSTPTTWTRTPKLAKDDHEPSLFLTLQSSGESMMCQHGRLAVLQAGEFAVYVTTSPYTLMFDQGLDVQFFRVPIAELALPEKAITEVCSRTFDVGDAVPGLAADYLKRMACDPQLRVRTVADTLSTPTIDLIRAAILSSPADPIRSHESMETTLELRLFQYLRAHLGDHQLSAAQVASAHYISVRQLYAVLARSGVSLGDWLRCQRLEACRKELARPGSGFRTIASIARDWGFADATHFSRAFRVAYGVSPREWRAVVVRAAKSS
jgi:AraC-like DNA-binding protein